MPLRFSDGHMDGQRHRKRRPPVPSGILALCPKSIFVFLAAIFPPWPTWEPFHPISSLIAEGIREKSLLIASYKRERAIHKSQAIMYPGQSYYTPNVPVMSCLLSWNSLRMCPRQLYAARHLLSPWATFHTSRPILPSIHGLMPWL